MKPDIFDAGKFWMEVWSTEKFNFSLGGGALPIPPHKSRKLSIFNNQSHFGSTIDVEASTSFEDWLDEKVI